MKNVKKFKTVKRKVHLKSKINKASPITEANEKVNDTTIWSIQLRDTGNAVRVQILSMLHLL